MCEGWLILYIFLDDIQQVFHAERLSHKLITAGSLGLADVLVEGIGAKGNDGDVVVDLLDDAGCIQKSYRDGHLRRR